MAIYSCNLKSIGRTTHAAGTAGAHLSYIGRERAEPERFASNMPVDPKAARTWMDNQERADRKNARVCDKIRIALPRELDSQQRADLVRSFAEDLTGGRVPWYAAIHQTGRDAHNPHAHVVIRDRDIETGRRVVRLSDSKRDREKAGLSPSAAEWVRERWEHSANQALERAGHDVRVDRRSLAAQGIEREPTIHVGPRANQIDRTVERPESQTRVTGNGRVIDYPYIDAGRTRRERNNEIVDFNLEKDLRAPDLRTRAQAQLERDQRAKDKVIEDRHIAAERRETLERRRLAETYRQRRDEIRTHRDQERQEGRATLRRHYEPKIRELKQRQDEERTELRDRQSRISQRLMLAVDFTGRARAKRTAAWEKLRAEQSAAKRVLRDDYREKRRALSQAVNGRYTPMMDELRQESRTGFAEFDDRHRSARQERESEQQRREAERENARQALEAQLREVEQRHKSQPRQAERAGRESPLSDLHGRAAAAPDAREQPEDRPEPVRSSKFREKMRRDRARERGRER